MEETGAFFEPTLAALFVREAFSPSTRSAVCEGSSPAPSLHPSLPTCRPLILLTLPFLMVMCLRSQAVTQREPKDGPALSPDCAQFSHRAQSMHSMH